MYGYFDESIINIDGVKYCFLGFVVFSERPFDNIILKEFSRTKSSLKNRLEIKYSNVRDSKIKEIVLSKIKSSSNYHDFQFEKITAQDNIHKIINKLIVQIMEKYFETNSKDKIAILYDKVTYEIGLTGILKTFSNIKKFEMANSRREFGIQYADWIVGEAAENFKQKNQA